MTLSLHGEIVTLKRADRFSYGNKVGYKIIFLNPDGAQHAPIEDYWEFECEYETL